jgi:hypothetical protein
MRKILRYDVYKMNSLIFSLSYCVLVIWAFLSLGYAWALDEGTLSNHPIDVFLANSFQVFSFPSHHILTFTLDYLPDLHFLGFLFFPLLLVNIALYCIIIERFSILFRKKETIN